MLKNKIFKVFGVAACSIFIESQLYILNKNNYEKNNSTTAFINKLLPGGAVNGTKQLYQLNNVSYDDPITKPLLKDYIPKDATQQNLFLSKYPNYDGRGIKIAIIDSAVDVSLDGLQKTSDGSPKIIDCVDFTDVGDVDTSVIREMDCERILIGLSGRKLKIPEKWKNPSGEWHLGIKALQKPVTSGKTIMNLPKMDCIVWFDGKKWLACIDDTLQGDLKNAKVLTNFRDEHEYGILNLYQENMSYCINVYNDGNVLEIFMPLQIHGTTVAQIAAANFPDEPERNGLAPGAQIITINILMNGTKSDEIILKDALLKCIEMKVDIVNYSISTFIKEKENENLVKEMVEKHNILIFKSAGNEGPFFSSINKNDVRVQDLIFKIGALLTPMMKKNIYNIDDDDNNQSSCVAYFSSRGPYPNGQYAIDFVAPGAAIVELPKFSSVKNRICEGTSCSAPNAAGSVACLLSALKANGISYSPAMIKTALSKTAKLPVNGNKHEFGNGIIQIDAAFDYCKNLMNENSKNESINSKKQSILCIRKNGDPDIKKLFFVLPSIINTVLHDVYTVDDENESIKNIILDLISYTVEDKNIEAKWILRISPDAEKFLQLSEINRHNKIYVNIDTTKLEPGILHHAEIQVFHPLKPSTDPIFQIPVIVIIPLNISESQDFHFQKEIILSNENSFNIFVEQGYESSQYCEIQVIPLEENFNSDNVFMQYATKKAKTFLFTSEKPKTSYVFQLKSKKVHQLCIHQRRASSTPQKFKVELKHSD